MKKILLIEDERELIDSTTEILNKFGYEVVSTTNGKEAIEIYKKMGEDISLLLIDYSMPGLNGIQTYDKIREINPKVKGILISGQLSDAAMELCGMTNLRKPYEMRELDRLIKYLSR